MKADNTIALISQVKLLADQFIIMELSRYGIHGIVPSHGSILYSLLECESLTMGELSDKINKDPSTVTTLVKKLELLGYVKVYKDSRDKRISRVKLTKKGDTFKNIFKNISETMSEILRQYFINHPQSIDKYTFLQNSAFTHWVKEKCSKMC